MFKIRNLFFALFFSIIILIPVIGYLYIDNFTIFPYYGNSALKISEFFWIFYYEHFNTVEYGIFSWPSNETNDILFMDRLIPRTLLLGLNSLVGLDSSFFIFNALIFIYFIYVMQQWFKQHYPNSNIALLFLFLTLITLYPLVDIKFYFLDHYTDPTLAALRGYGFLLPFSYFLHLDLKLQNSRLNDSNFFFSCLMFAFTPYIYSYLFFISFFVFSIRFIYHRMFSTKNVILAIFAGIATLPYVFVQMGNSSIPEFNEFLIRYGAVFTHEPNLYELKFISGYVLFSVIGFYLSKWKGFSALLIYSFAALFASNLNILSGVSVQPLHYRLIFLDFIFPAAIVCYFANLVLNKNLILICSILCLIPPTIRQIESIDFLKNNGHIFYDYKFLDQIDILEDSILFDSPYSAVWAKIHGYKSYIPLMWELKDNDEFFSRLDLAEDILLKNNININANNWRYLSLHVPYAYNSQHGLKSKELNLIQTLPPKYIFTIKDKCEVMSDYELILSPTSNSCFYKIYE